MIAKAVVLAVLILAGLATADAIRQDGRTTRTEVAPTAGDSPDVSFESGDYEAVGEATPTRVLRNGRLYLDADAIDAAFPAPLIGVPYSIAHIASGPNGTLALAIYKFPTIGPPRNGIELWRNGEPLGAIPVPPGTFGGGLGFTEDGLVAAISAGGRRTTLFDFRGRVTAREPGAAA